VYKPLKAAQAVHNQHQELRNVLPPAVKKPLLELAGELADIGVEFTGSNNLVDHLHKSEDVISLATELTQDKSKKSELHNAITKFVEHRLSTGQQAAMLRDAKGQGLELLQKASVSMVKAIKGNGKEGAGDMYYKFLKELPDLTPVL